CNVRTRAEAEDGRARSIPINRCAGTVRVGNGPNRWLEVKSTRRNRRANGRVATRADDRRPLSQWRTQRRGGATVAATRVYQRLQSQRRNRCVVGRSRSERAEILSNF